MTDNDSLFINAALDGVERDAHTKILPERYYALHFDGACQWGEVRRTGYGFSVDLIDRGVKTTVARAFGYVTENVGREHLNSSNTAEYKGLIAGLEYLLERGWADEPIVCFGDSKMVINQMFGEWVPKAGLYLPFAAKAKETLGSFSSIDGTWVPRIRNYTADGLSKKGAKRQATFIRQFV